MLGLSRRLVLSALWVFALAGTGHAQTLNLMDLIGAGTSMKIIEAGTATSNSLAGFEAFKQGLWREAAAKGVSRATFDQALAGVTPDPRVLEKAAAQPEFVTPVWDYLKSAVSDKRIEDGSARLVELSGILDAVEATYGVSRYVVAAIWGIESSYGQVLENREIVKPVIRSLTTLAYLGGKRSKFGRSQLIAALGILERGDTTPDRMLGSWAGAMGHTQFIPTTYVAYAVDFDRDGRRDIWDSLADALASTANYLKASGWRAGETWGYEVTLPHGFNYNSAGTRRTLGGWVSLGVKRTQARAFPRPDDTARLLLPAGARGPAFLMVKNFDVIKRYNNADSYALAVGHLADRLMGAQPFVAAWPVGDRTLARSEREELQQLLSRRGFDPGGIDGEIGPRTEAALRAYQSSIGATPDGFATKNLLDRLRERT